MCIHSLIYSTVPVFRVLNVIWYIIWPYMPHVGPNSRTNIHPNVRTEHTVSTLYTIPGRAKTAKTLEKNWRNLLCCTNHHVHLPPSNTGPIRHCFPPVADPLLPLQ